MRLPSPLFPCRAVWKSQQGQSLVEITFAIGVISIVLVSMLTTILLSLRNARVSLEQTRSTQYAQETLEWLRRLRDSEGWGHFYDGVNSRGGSLSYCMPSLPAGWSALLTQSQGACELDDVIPNTPYRRSLQIEVISGTQIRARSTVTRPGSSGDVSTTLESVLTDWE